MNNQKMDLKNYNLQSLNNTELNEVIGGSWKSFFHGLFVAALGAGEIMGGLATYLFDGGTLLKEGVKDGIAGVDEMQGSF